MPTLIPPEGRLDSCPGYPGVLCPVRPCPGSKDLAVCDHLAKLGAWRALGPDEQASRLSIPRPSIDPVLRDAVNACPDRGPVLPLSMQDDCGCRGKELSECRAGRGGIPGRVTLRDCLACKAVTDQQETPR